MDEITNSIQNKLKVTCKKKIINNKQCNKLSNENNVDNCNLSELNQYKKNITSLIKQTLYAKRKEFVFEPTIFGNNSPENIKLLKNAFDVRQQQMKEGNIAQISIGNFDGWEDLDIGHSSGLDCKKKDNSIVMEIKNKFNTCNSSSQKTLLDKLAKYKKENPTTRCIWAIANPKPNCQKMKETIIYDGVEIEKIQGIELFKLVFNINGIDYSENIINTIKNINYDCLKHLTLLQR